MRLRKLKIKMNLGLAKVAPLTHLIPEKPRRAVRDWLIGITRPKEYGTYRFPIQDGKIDWPLGINEYGMFRAENGLGQGAKLYAKSLALSGVPYTLVNTNFLDFLPQVDHSMDDKITTEGKYAINVMHVNANQWEDACHFFPHRMFDNHYNIGIWVWEADTLPRPWVEKLPHVDEIWTPSQFVADAFRKETDKPVITMPYGIEAPVDGSTRADFGFGEDDFLVLSMYDSNSQSSRKNPEGAIEAFIRAFGGRNTRARLVLKAGNEKPEALARLKERLEAAGVRYALVTERMDKPRLNALIACCNVFLSMHRSEGFGLVIAEAMALGVPVVATGYSANVEFMPEDCTCRVKYTLIPMGNDYVYQDDALRWADPDPDDAAAYLRKLYDDPAEAKRMAAGAKAFIQERHSLERIAGLIRKRYDEICEKLEAEGRLARKA